LCTQTTFSEKPSKNIHERFREIFEKLRQFNLKTEPDMRIFKDRNYLGHVVTIEGIKPDPQKIKGIKDFPTPRNTTDVKSFIGLAGYYGKFIPQFSRLRNL
jgi:hypothetical protein